MTIFDNQNNNQVDQYSVNNVTDIPQPIIVNPNKQNKRLIIIVLLITVLLLCGGVFAIYINNNIIKNEKIVSSSPFPTQSITNLTPTPNPTAGWKTYLNNTYSYDCQYPYSWSVMDINPYYVRFTSSSNNPPKDPFITIQVQENKKLLDIRSWHKETYPSYLFDTLSLKDGEFINHKALIFEDKIDGSRVIWFEYGNQVYSVSLTYSGNPKSTEINEIYNQILSTFKFIDSQKKEDLSLCFNSNYSNQLYTRFNLSVSKEEAIKTLTVYKAYDVRDKGNNVYYFHLPDGEICSGVKQLKTLKSILEVDAVPFMPGADP